MKFKSLKNSVILIVICILVTVLPAPAFGQSSVNPTSISSPISSVQDLERRLSNSEFQQELIIKNLESSNQYNQFLITGIGAIVAFLITIQGVVAYRQSDFESENIKRVNEIMGVIKDTLQARLTEEERARQEAEDAKKEVEKIVQDIEKLQLFLKKYQTTIKYDRENIENIAVTLAKTARHDFRKSDKKNDLADFSQKFDIFNVQYRNTESDPVEFTARVFYIKGIASHYFNHPEQAKNYLKQVVSQTDLIPGEIKVQSERRIANSYYYLGIIESNFDNNDEAIRLFKEARELDVRKDDLLTKVVIAESYLMLRDYENTISILDEIKSYVGTQEIHTRLQNRADLLLVNTKILAHESNWQQESKRILEEIYSKDPFYYYATATLAQFCVQDEPERAQKLFKETLETITRSGDLIILEEVRSKILLLMVTALCCIGASTEDLSIKEAEEYLKKANQLRESLPRVDSQVCTVYSPLSKRNEKAEVISQHINRIRNREVYLLHPNA